MQLSGGVCRGGCPVKLSLDGAFVKRGCAGICAAWAKLVAQTSFLPATKYARENLVDISQLPFQIEGPLNLLTGDPAGYALVPSTSSRKFSPSFQARMAWLCTVR